MRKKSIVSNITKISLLLFSLFTIFVIIVVTFSYYKNYIDNLNFLQTKSFDNYKNIISKTCDNILTRYEIEYKLGILNKREEIKNRAYFAYSLLQNLYFSNKDKLSLKKMKEYAINLLDLIRFDNGIGYYDIFDVNGDVVHSPYINNYEVAAFQNILVNIKNGNNKFFIVNWVHPFKKNSLSPKIIFGIYFEKFKWIVITGFYINDFQKSFDKQFIAKINVLKIPVNIGLLILGKKNNILAKVQVPNKGLLEKLQNVKDVDKFSFISCNNLHYTVFSNRIFANGWRVITYFNNEVVESNFAQTKKKLLKTFYMQLIIILLATFISFILFLYFIKNFRFYLFSQFNKLIDFIKKVPENYEKINLDDLDFYEIHEIAKYTNEMVDTISHLNKEKEAIHKQVVKERNFLNTILENLPIGITVLASDLTIEYGNKICFDMLDYDSSVIGKHFDLFIPEDISKEKFLLPQILEEVKKTLKPLKLEKIKFFKKDGSPIYVFFSVAPVISEDKKQVDKYVMLFFDITEEEKLKREILKLNRAVENAPISIVITNTNAEIEYVNPFFVETTGYSLNEVKGKKPSFFGTTHNRQFYQEIRKSLLKGETWSGEFLNRKKNGEEFWEQTLIAPIINEKGVVINFVAVKEDITERKNFIEQLRIAKEKAELANKVKSEFLANMSHEIRTPMNAIMGFIDLVLNTNLEENQRKYLEIVKESTENLLRILNDILDISKFESSKMEFDNKPFNLKRFINNSCQIFSSKIYEKGLDFKIEIDENIPDVLIGDEVRISQVLNNLLNNAIKFTEKGRISLKVKVLNIENNLAEILFSISDTGIGIPEDKIDAIFDAFTQADGSITRRFGGTGLGLTISSKIVQEYQGKIWVESEEGKGSTFYFTLKLPVSHVKIDEHGKKEDKKVIFSKTKPDILVAEDNETNQILIKELLTSIGINVTIAENGLEAIKILSEKDFDLIFMDWHMPIMDGVEALEILRAVEKGKEVANSKVSPEILEKLKGRKFKIVALTAAAMKKEKEALLKKGFDDYISKPFKVEELNEILLKYLGNKLDKSSTVSGKKIDLSYIKKLVGDNEQLVNKILNSFKSTYATSIENIKKGLSKENFDEIYTNAHTLKGTAFNIGFNEIGEIAKAIEMASKNKDIEEIENLLEKLEEIGELIP